MDNETLQAKLLDLYQVVGGLMLDIPTESKEDYTLHFLLQSLDHQHTAMLDLLAALEDYLDPDSPH